MLTYPSNKIFLFTTSFVSSLGTLLIAHSAMAVSFPLPNTYGDVLTTGTQTILTNANSNGLDDPENLNVSGKDPIFAFDLELALGLEDGALGFTAGDTSAIASDPFSFRTGDRISFDWTFTSNHSSFESDRDDYGFVVIGEQVIPLVDTTEPDSTGMFSYTFSNDETYQFGIGVTDIGDDITSSILSVSNFNYQPIPEPLTILGAGTAAAIGAWFKRKSKGSK